MTDPHVRKQVTDSLDIGANVKRYAAYYKGRLLGIGRVVYQRKGDLRNRINDMIANIMYYFMNTGVGYDDPKHVPWSFAKEKSKDLAQELINDGIIEIKEI